LKVSAPIGDVLIASASGAYSRSERPWPPTSFGSGKIHSPCDFALARSSRSTGCQVQRSAACALLVVQLLGWIDLLLHEAAYAFCEHVDVFGLLEVQAGLSQMRK